MNTSDLSCFNFTHGLVKTVLISKLTLASLGVVACTLVIFLILVSKGYKLFVYRLVIYFMSITFFQALIFIAEVVPVHQVHSIVKVRKGWDPLCTMFGFLDQIALWMGILAILWITFYLLKIIWNLHKVQNRDMQQLPEENDQRPKHQAFSKHELLGLVVVLVFPLTFNWIPFVSGMYGISGLWCWIKLTKDNCRQDFTVGLTLQFSLFYGPLMVVIFFCFIGILVIVVFLCKGSLNKWGLARRQYQRGTREMMIVLLCPFLYNLLCFLLLANRIYSAISTKHDDAISYPLWIAHAIGDPCRVLLPPLAVLLHPNLWKNLICRNRNRDETETYFSVPPEDSDIPDGIRIKGRKFVSSYGSVLPAAM